MHGYIQDSTGTALYAATVNLISANDTISMLTDKDGFFEFSRLKAYRFELIVSINGYQPYHKLFEFEPGKKNYQIDPIHLHIEYKSLREVTIIGIKPVTIKIDTIEYNANAFTVRQGSELEDLLKKLPGVTVDMAGNVYAQGKKIVKVRVNGKDFFGGNVLTATKNLPANIVDRVQVIDDYGVLARLTGIKKNDPEKILNIELKKDDRNGAFGKLMGGIGNEERYAAGFFANYFKEETQLSLIVAGNNINQDAASVVQGSVNTSTSEATAGINDANSISLNYSDLFGKKWFGNGSYGYSGLHQSVQSNTSQNMFFEHGMNQQEQHNTNDSRSVSHALNYNLKYIPNTQTTVIVAPSFSTQHNYSNGITRFLTMQTDSGFQKNAEGITSNHTDNFSTAMSTVFTWEQVFKKSGRRMLVNANISYNRNKQMITNHTHIQTTFNDVKDSTNQEYSIYTDNNQTNLNAAVNYYEPIAKNSFFELGYIFQHTSSNESKQTIEPDSTNQLPVIVDSLSNEYHAFFITNRVHTGFTMSEKKINLLIGLDAEPGILKGASPAKSLQTEHAFFNIIPAAQFTYGFTKNKTISLNYSGSPSQPELFQLQPVIDFTNPQYPIEGNPNLKPEFTHNAGLRYNQFTYKKQEYQGFTVSLNFTRTQNKIITNIMHPKNNGPVIQKTTYLNQDGFYSINSNYNITFPALLKNKLVIATNGSAAFNNSVSMLDSIAYNNNSFFFSQRLNIQFVIPDQLEMNATANYSINTVPHSPGLGSGKAESIMVAINNRHYFLQKWVLIYTFSKTINYGLGSTYAPILLNAMIQKQFLKNKVACTLAAYNLVNANAMNSRTTNGNILTNNSTNLLGRYFLLSFSLKMQKFKKANL